jgi:hypothetical protein
MAKIKDASTINEKWKRRAGNAQQEYTEGVQNPRADWASQTSAAEKSYEQGVQAAIGRKSFGKGVRKTGTEGWQRAALTKGPSRFSQGVTDSGDAYASGFAPYQQVIASTQLPERGPKGDPKNINRVSTMAKALHQKKLELQGR